jgi:hypothetical protein
MAIVITEDDSQGGVDHVDAHRSILMVISPYAKDAMQGTCIIVLAAFLKRCGIH